MGVFSEQINAFVAAELSREALGSHVANLTNAGMQRLLQTGQGSPFFDATVDGQPYSGQGNPLGVNQEVLIRFTYVAQAVITAIVMLTTGFATPVAAPLFQDALSSLAAEGQPVGFQLLADLGSFAHLPIVILASLLDSQPVAIGVAAAPLAVRFANSIIVRVDGDYFQPAELDLQKLGHATEVVVGSVSPYNRKLDIQTDNGRPLQFTQPAGIYNDAVDAIQTRFGSLVTASRLDDWDFPNKYRPKHTGFTFTSPAISILRNLVA